MFIDLPPQQAFCVAQIVYHEARGESDLGKRAVAHVVLNRANKRQKTPCQVLKEPRQFQIKLRQTYVGKAWEHCYKIANAPGIDPTRGAMYFKTSSSATRWNLKFLTRIGNHLFYK